MRYRDPYRPVKPINFEALLWLVGGTLILAGVLYGAAYIGILNSKP